MTRLIALNGFAGSGKNTAAQALEGWQVVSFADPIRADLERLNPIVYPGHALCDVLKLYGGWDGAKRVFPEIRRLMQEYGMLMREKYGEDFWVNIALSKILLTDDPSVIVDLRFPNELEMVKRLGGVAVRITRPGVEAVNDHCSEHQNIECDYEIENTSIQHLHERMRQIAYPAVMSASLNDRVTESMEAKL